MHFDVSKRIDTAKSVEEITEAARSAFQKISKIVRSDPDKFQVKDIEATFGSINRTDVTTVRCKPADGGVMLVAEVDYRPSLAFWLILVLTLFSYIGWVIPIGFYLYQKGTVRTAVENVLQQVADEVRQTQALSIPQASSSTDELVKLAALKDRGLLTDEEFASQKSKLLSR